MTRRTCVSISDGWYKVLRRFLEETEPAPEQLRELSFPALIRVGSERGLLVNGWDVWTDHRKA